MSEASNIDGNVPADFPALAAPPMSAALAAAVKNSKPVPLRRPLRDLGVFLALSLPMLALMVAIMGIRRDLAELSPLWVGSVALIWIASFAASSYLGFVPAKGHVLPRTRTIYEVVAVACLLVISIGLFAFQSATSQTFTYSATAGNIVSHGAACSIIGVTAGIVPGLVALFLMRRFVPVGRLSVGLSLGAAGGSLSGLILHLHCPVTERFHVGVIHGGCLVLCALFVAGASQVLLRDRE